MCARGGLSVKHGSSVSSMSLPQVHGLMGFALLNSYHSKNSCVYSNNNSDVNTTNYIFVSGKTTLMHPFIMTTPQISGRYHFQVDLRGSNLPITITLPDIPDTPSEECLIVADKEISIEETSDVHTDDVHMRCTDPDTIHIVEHEPLANPLTVSHILALHVYFWPKSSKDMGISTHNKMMCRKGVKYQWFLYKGKHTPLGNPFDIPGMEKLRSVLQLQAFDVFYHVFYPVAGHSSNSTNCST